ncbi:MAG TPA: protease pro-enzyme activation domain-containing protein [Thermoplasmata archaeon]|nr:protease pro-enzyme activation domain-containing protein [Thermoplasmata archaeon]
MRIVLVAALLCATLVLGPLLAGTPAPAGASHGASMAGRSPAIWSDAVSIGPGTPVGPLPATTPIVVSLSLRTQDPAGLAEVIAAAGGSSGSPGRFLTESQFEARFSPAAGQVASVVAYLDLHGASRVSVTPDRLGVSATLPAGQVEKAFGVQLVRYGWAGDTPLYTASGSPRLPAGLASLVAGIGGLSDWANPGLSHELRAFGTHGKVVSPSRFVIDNVSGTQLFIGSDFTQAFGVSQLFPGSGAVANATFPTHEAVATILLSGFNNSTQQDTPAFDPVAVSAYFNDTFPSAWPHPAVVGVPVTIAGVTAPPPGGSGAIEDSSLDATENALDVEMAGSLAPGATIANFYFPASLYLATGVNPSIGDVADFFATTLASALSYNYSTSRLVAVSNSFGLPDLNDSLWNSELVHAAAIGVSVIAASGDQGNAPNDLSGRFQGQWPTWPASAAFADGATIAVGGLSVQLGGSPAGWSNSTGVNATFDASITGIASASAWYDVSGGAGTFSGSEGGASTIVAEPSWQFDSAAQPAIANSSAQQGIGQLARSEPDVSFVANTTIAYTAHDSTGVYFETLQGTSIAAPVFAGFLASAAAVAGHTFGMLDPELYRMASYYAAHPGPSDPFVDVTAGSNYEFAAAPGWDAVTGWGFLLAPAFLAADANASIRDYVYTGPTPGIPNPGVTPPPAPAPVPIATLLILGFALAAAAAIAIVLGRPRAPRHVPPPYYGPPAPPLPAYGAPPPSAPGPLAPGPPAYAYAPRVPGGGFGASPPPGPAMFHCPYCGSLRPAEPVRCPGCGAF